MKILKLSYVEGATAAQRTIAFKRLIKLLVAVAGGEVVVSQKFIEAFDETLPLICDDLPNGDVRFRTPTPGKAI